MPAYEVWPIEGDEIATGDPLTFSTARKAVATSLRYLRKPSIDFVGIQVEGSGTFSTLTLDNQTIVIKHRYHEPDTLIRTGIFSEEEADAIIDAYRGKRILPKTILDKRNRLANIGLQSIKRAAESLGYKTRIFTDYSDSIIAQYK
jgi:hypothetical protein